MPLVYTYNLACKSFKFFRRVLSTFFLLALHFTFYSIFKQKDKWCVIHTYNALLNFVTKGRCLLSYTYNIYTVSQVNTIQFFIFIIRWWFLYLLPNSKKQFLSNMWYGAIRKIWSFIYDPKIHKKNWTWWLIWSNETSYRISEDGIVFVIKNSFKKLVIFLFLLDVKITKL